MKIRVAVIFGGKSTEHEISIISAIQAIHAFDTDKYEIIPVYMTKDSVCYAGEGVGDIASYQKDIKELLSKAVQVDFEKDGDRVFLMRHERKLFGSNIFSEIDVAFPIVHGTNVEDGTLAGFLLTLGLAVVGPDVLSSAIGMDKYIMKAVLRESGVPFLDCLIFNVKDSENMAAIRTSVEEKFGYPVIVKPVNLGSSIGISKADTGEELMEALELAFTFADRVLIEKAIINLKEVNCAVLGDYEEAIASECESPIVNTGEVLDFDKKYMNNGGSKSAKGSKPVNAKCGNTGLTPSKMQGTGAAKGSGMASLSRELPANISAEKREEIRELSLKAFKALGLSGVTRIDFMLDMDDNERVYLNEVNTIPGSLAFYLWEAAGIPYKELLDRLVKLALKAQREKNKKIYTFDTNVLAGVRI